MALSKMNVPTDNTNIPTGLFPSDIYIPLPVVRDKLAVSAEIKHGIRVDTKICIEPWLKPMRDSLCLHTRNNCKVQKNWLNSLLLCTTQTKIKVQTTPNEIPDLERKYLRKVCKGRGKHEGPHFKGLASKSLILIKRMPYKACFSTKSLSTIISYLDDDQLLFVSKKCIRIYVDLNFCLCESNLRNTKLDEITNRKISDPVLIYKREGKVFYVIGSCNGFLNTVTDISYEKSATAYFDISRNKFVDSIDREHCFVINNKRSHRDVMPARPVSLDPVGSKRLDHNTNYLCSCTTVPLFRATVAQATDDVGERRPLYYNSRSSGQDISIDQYSFYQPRYTSILQNQNVDHQTRIRSGQQNVAYRNFSTTEERMSSFVVRWPYQSQQQKVKNMVSWGFFYTGNGDLIRCYSCGIGLKDWGDEDDPLTEHVRYSPDCQFLIDSIPPTQLARIKASFLSNNVVSTRESIPSTRDGYNNTSAETGRNADEIVLLVQPRNPQYKTKAVRISSFSKWPRDMTQTPVELAEAGFFYTGFNDVVRCYVCDGGLQKWSPEDNPWVEHARWFSHCAYVRQIKGEDFIELVRLSAEHEQLEAEGAAGGMNENTAEQTENIASDMSGLHISAKSEDLPGSKLKEHNNGELLQIVKEILPECPEAVIKEAMADMNMKGEEVTADSLLIRITEPYARSMQNVPRPSSAESFGKEPETLIELIEETEKLRSVVKCHDCKERDANCLFLPCAHHIFCMFCGKDVSICPLCKKIVKNKVKTFMS